MKRPTIYNHHDNVVTLLPGEFYASCSGEKVLLRTVLGSCVSACLYDPIADVVGMNHFLLSNNRYAKNMDYKETEAGRYGIQSMELLIDKMMKAGAEKGRLQAKAFGGATLFSAKKEDNFFCVGDVNSQFINAFLENENIRLIASDLKGIHGRIIYFSSQTFRVDMHRLDNSSLKNVAEAEHKYWTDSVRAKTNDAAPLTGKSERIRKAQSIDP